MASAQIFSACRPVVGRMALNVARLSTQRPAALRKQLGPCARFPKTVLSRTSVATRVHRLQYVTASVTTSSPTVVTREEVFTSDPYNNVSESIFEKIGKNHHQNPDHPLGIIKQAIWDYFDNDHDDGEFTKFDDLKPIVTTTMNFDEMLVPKDHVSRDPNDTYYINKETVLRCHTSAHQAGLLRDGFRKFLVTGDVYRRDSIDATHYPAFHQMEGVRVFEKAEWEAAGCTGTELAERELKRALGGMVQHLFGDVEMRWVDAYFPFTEPSFELEIFFKGEWLEVLGCGVMQQAILEGADLGDKKAWAFGLGLERLAMVLFDIPDIRLFWTSDERFTSQFQAGCFVQGGSAVKFASFSKFPPCLKDVSFWLETPEQNIENNLCEVVRNIGGDLVEAVTLIDDFTNKKTGKRSNCFRITYRSMERSLTNEEIDNLQEQVREAIEQKLGAELR
uniref:phenylalanine--tRNA ligase n=1 Tax=Pyramimonas obovata TaxID=1411642 RepID=A0A7S0N3C7_9CHLO|mmetsp:Transcript_19733/g.43137  ORF Transcript_19733/g.43137 Transcript_19733/m.43137 type:complete len:449 (+) Transcript_19733:39-1385(+)|eukprot:CAMPEP_0118958708 /NCGR_PEP_ID=MMETSP1169-20130426/62761_1 /TAXON_ID=36882 /ORGANISM="Pyramimonas obovata, Strain CCMP722" /LENGTH=448 /DNA_ID=CAMNT_0006906833 /DNA_START=34 /DNA_END=1380 /DNA_ORIENTATION=+